MVKMTITVWYKGDVDQVIENVRCIKQKNGAIEIISTSGEAEMIDIIRLDADTYITIGGDE